MDREINLDWLLANRQYKEVALRGYRTAEEKNDYLSFLKNATTLIKDKHNSPITYVDEGLMGYSKGLRKILSHFVGTGYADALAKELVEAGAVGVDPIVAIDAVVTSEMKDVEMMVWEPYRKVEPSKTRTERIDYNATKTVARRIAAFDYTKTSSLPRLHLYMAFKAFENFRNIREGRDGTAAHGHEDLSAGEWAAVVLEHSAILKAAAGDGHACKSAQSAYDKRKKGDYAALCKVISEQRSSLLKHIKGE